jgi:hypothetical protein
MPSKAEIRKIEKRLLKRPGYYLVELKGAIGGLKKVGGFTELWHSSGLRLRHLKVWAELEDFDDDSNGLEHFYSDFREVNGAVLDGGFKIKAKFIGKGLVELLKKV